MLNTILNLTIVAVFATLLGMVAVAVLDVEPERPPLRRMVLDVAAPEDVTMVVHWRGQALRLPVCFELAEGQDPHAVDLRGDRVSDSVIRCEFAGHIFEIHTEPATAMTWDVDTLRGQMSGEVEYVHYRVFLREQDGVWFREQWKRPEGGELLSRVNADEIPTILLRGPRPIPRTRTAGLSAAQPLEALPAR